MVPIFSSLVSVPAGLERMPLPTDRGQLPRGREVAAREPRVDRFEPGPRRGGQHLGIGGTQGPWSAHV
ncbi:hypothetical protein SVIOM342S_10360 [Streptomyces violaceorubidus]